VRNYNRTVRTGE